MMLTFDVIDPLNRFALHRFSFHAVYSMDEENLFIEAAASPGGGRLTLTGQLGEVMRESAQAALSIVKSRAEALGIDANRLRKTDIHVHVPAGATPLAASEATPQARDEAVNSDMPRRNIRLLPYRSASLPAVIRNAAKVTP